MENLKNVTVLFRMELKELWEEMRPFIDENLVVRNLLPMVLCSSGSSTPKLLKAKEVWELFNV